MTYEDVHTRIMWPEAIIDAAGLICLGGDLRLAIPLLVLGASLHTVLILALFTLTNLEDDSE